MAKVLVLHSGGMDSTTCLFAAKAAGHDTHSLGIDYGQRLSVELLFARQQCEKLGVPREVIQVHWAKPDRVIPSNRAVADMSKTVSPAFLPSRNVVFLSLAMAHAAGIGANEVQIGLNCIDFSGYPDCTEEFFESYKAMSAIANPGGPTIAAPLLKMSKQEIARLAHKLGLGEHDTWSCYRPQIVQGGVVPCQTCDACRLHSHAWQPLR
jgi:7-cyano-7-deazaguanine synthase